MSMSKYKEKDNNKDIPLNKYVFHSIGTNHDDRDDFAITEAIDMDTAIKQFKEYYTNACKDNVQLIDLYREGYVKNMMIIGKY